MIAHFPAFSKLELQHKNSIEEITGGFPPYSDFNFTSLFCWNVDGSAAVSLLNDNLVIRIPDYTSAKIIYSILGKNRLDDSLHQLLEVASELNMVPEDTISSIQHQHRFKIAEDRGNFDYIYNLADLAKLTGRQHKKKRHKVNRVRETFADKLRVDNMNYVDEDLVSKIEAVFERWRKHSKQSEKELQSESIAIRRLLENADSLDLFVTLVSVETEPVAFSINEVLDDKNALCHFEKAAPIHHHIFSFVAHQAAEHLLAQDCEFVNWEQDMDIPGLRQLKMSYHPSSMLKKYTVNKA